MNSIGNFVNPLASIPGASLEAPIVILLTKLDKSKVLVSLDNIKFIETTPDTLVRFVNGETLIVSESLEEVARLVEDFKVRCLAASQIAAGGPSAVLGGNSAWT